MPDPTPVIIWFRRDLRLEDNPALEQARHSGQRIIALYVHETDCKKPPGAARSWWLHFSLTSLRDDLARKGVALVIRRGKAAGILDDIIKETKANAVFWNRRYERDRIENDRAIKADLKDRGIAVKSFRASLLCEPWEVKTRSGEDYYRVFSPYWRAATAQIKVTEPLVLPHAFAGFDGKINSLSIEDLALLPTKPDWGSKMKAYWQPGENGAKNRLKTFLDGPVGNYTDGRNRPDKEGTSRLSPHLAFGEISPRQVWHAAVEKLGDADENSRSQLNKFLSEVGWREFSYVLLYHNPNLDNENFRDNFDRFPWERNPDALVRWQKGLTGYPFVDAGMRELWETGWQHNRVRMVTASFLIKHLLIDWREGEKWFWDTLVDADPGSNAAGWQWVAGSGADAAPYFRIFNPFIQGRKFDPQGEYVRRWVPELKRLPTTFIHTPWEAPEQVLGEAGVTLGDTYPAPIVDHNKARERALAAYEETKG